MREKDSTTMQYRNGIIKLLSYLAKSINCCAEEFWIATFYKILRDF